MHTIQDWAIGEFRLPAVPQIVFATQEHKIEEWINRYIRQPWMDHIIALKPSLEHRHSQLAIGMHVNTSQRLTTEELSLFRRKAGGGDVRPPVTVTLATPFNILSFRLWRSQRGVLDFEKLSLFQDLLMDPDILKVCVSCVNAEGFDKYFGCKPVSVTPVLARNQSWAGYLRSHWPKMEFGSIKSLHCYPWHKHSQIDAEQLERSHVCAYVSLIGWLRNNMLRYVEPCRASRDSCWMGTHVYAVDDDLSDGEKSHLFHKYKRELPLFLQPLLSSDESRSATVSSDDRRNHWSNQSDSHHSDTHRSDVKDWSDGNNWSDWHSNKDWQSNKDWHSSKDKDWPSAKEWHSNNEWHSSTNKDRHKDRPWTSSGKEWTPSGPSGRDRFARKQVEDGWDNSLSQDRSVSPMEIGRKVVHDDEQRLGKRVPKRTVPEPLQVASDSSDDGFYSRPRK